MDVESIVAGHRPDDACTGPDPQWEPGPAEAAIAAVAAAVDGLFAVDLTTPGTGATLDLLRAVETQARRLYGMSVAVIAEIDHRGLAAPAGQLSCTALVRQVINIGRGDAAARVRLAAATSVSTGLSGAPIPPKLPLLAAAVRTGTVGARHADLAASVFKAFDVSVPAELRDSVEKFLVEQAAVTDPVTFDQVCRRIVLAANPDGPEEEQDAHDKQEFHIGARRPNGLTKVWGLLDDITVESLRAVFGAMCAPAAGRTGTCNPKDPDPDPTPTPAPTPTPGPEPDDGGEAVSVDGTDDTNGTVGTNDADSNNGTDDTDSTNGGDPAGAGAGASGGVEGDTPAGGEQPGDTGPSENGPTFPPDPDATTPDQPVDTATPENPGPDDTGPPEHIASPDDAAPPEAHDRGPVGTGVDPPPTWRAGRVPYQWAPLGTLPGDYPELKPRLFGDDRCPQPDPARQSDPTGRPRAATLRAQALGIILAKFLDAGHAPTQGGEKPHLLVTVTERSLRDRLGHGRLGYGTHISIKQVRMLACDSKVIAAVLGGRSELLEMGRAMRAFNAATARAILLRDQGCIFPGCDMPGQWSENHHIQPWEDGGLSDYSNGCLLCRRHHQLIHRDQWEVQMAPDGTPQIIPPATHDPDRKPIRNTLNHAPEFAWPRPS